MLIKIIPVFKVRDMTLALKHYTSVLDFVIADPLSSVNDPVIDLINEETILQITTLESNQLFGSVANVLVDNVDVLFAKYKSRGLDNPGSADSPVEEAPIDQTWGRREFYVKDTDGNTLRFFQLINSK